MWGASSKLSPRIWSPDESSWALGMCSIEVVKSEGATVAGGCSNSMLCSPPPMAPSGCEPKSMSTPWLNSWTAKRGCSSKNVSSGGAVEASRCSAKLPVCGRTADGETNVGSCRVSTGATGPGDVPKLFSVNLRSLSTADASGAPSIGPSTLWFGGLAGDVPSTGGLPNLSSWNFRNFSTAD